MADEAVMPLESRAEHSEERRIALEDMLSSIGEVAYRWDLESDAVTWWGRVDEVLGIGDIKQISTGIAFGRLLDPDNMTSRYDTVVNSSQRDSGSGVTYKIRYRMRSSETATTYMWVEDRGRWMSGVGGKPIRAEGVLQVITDQHEEEEKLAFLSRYDSLTGQLNRGRLLEVLEDAISDSRRYRSSAAFVVASIDNIRAINEAYGFEIADQVIAAVAKRLKAALRGSDAIGRFSGNKLGMVLVNCSDDDLKNAAERFLSCVRDEVIATDEGPVSVTLTVGGVVVPRYARSVSVAIARAQEALDIAKQRRAGTFAAYQISPDKERTRHANTEVADNILTAINENRIVLAFQPVVRATDRTVAFHEGLARIRLEDGTLLPAARFVDVAEKLGLVRLLDHRVLDIGFQSLQTDPELRFSINISASTAMNEDWLSGLSARLVQAPEVAPRLTIELTETAALSSLEDSTRFVSTVRDLGCRVAIDDFGAGYTSFRNLRVLDVDTVKIDGSFIRNINESPEDQAFVKLLVDLANTLNVSTVAEWVSDSEKAELLTEIGVEYLQGEYFGLSDTNSEIIHNARPFLPDDATTS